MRGSSPRMRVEVSPRVGSAGDGMADAQGRGIDQHNGHAGALGAAVRPGMVGAALTMTSLGLAPTRRGHAEHTAALLNSSGLWVSSRTRGGRGWHAAAASGRFSIGPPMQLVERDSSAWGILLDDRHSTEMCHDIVLRNKACGDTCACADHGSDRLVCAKPAAILHPALRRVGGARGALLLNRPRPPTSGWIAESPVTPGSLVCDPDEQMSGLCVMWLTEGFQPPA